MMETLFYCAAILCCYSYFLYPLVLVLLPCRQTGVADIAGSDELPRFSLIITVHNEDARIREKIVNSLEIDYQDDRLEIIVASDCSTDGTDRIVEEYSAQGIRLVRPDQRKGKEYAQLCAIRIASGDVLVFSDVATQIPADALRILAGEFADSRIGAVSSEDRFVSQDGTVAGEGAYVRYEMWLRRLESKRAGLVGLSGSFFAARRIVCENWDIASPSDFTTALNCVQMGLVAISSPKVIGIYSDVKDPELEYGRKIRTVVRGMTALARHPEALNPLRTGLFAFQVLSHKILRWGVPWFLLLLLIVTLVLQGQGAVYRMALLLQATFYLLAVAGWLSTRLRMSAIVSITYFFVLTNLALAQATILFLSGKRMTMWNPSVR